MVRDYPDHPKVGEIIERNRRAISATIFGLTHVRKQATQGDNVDNNGIQIDGASSGKSKKQFVDPFKRLQDQGRIVIPPFDQLTLAVMPENSTEIRPAIEAMSVNIESFGWRIEPRIPIVERTPVEILEQLAMDSIVAKNFFRNAFAEEASLEEFRDKLRCDLEATGNFYVEFVERPGSGEIDGLNHLPSWTMRLGVVDDDPTEFVDLRLEEDVRLVPMPEPEDPAASPSNEEETLEAKNVPEGSTIVSKQLMLEEHSFQLKTQTRFKRFRRYVQVRFTSTGNTKSVRQIWFKELGDPRLIAVKDGHVVQREELTDASDSGKEQPRYVLETNNRVVIRNSKNGFPVRWAANPVKHIRIYSTRSPYGLPRYTGHLFAVFGSRAAEEINFTTFKNNNIPSLAITVTNGALTDESIDRIDEFVEAAIQSDDNYSKFLLLEADPSTEGMRDPGSVKIEIKPLTKDQHTDALFQEYQDKNDERIRRAWRLPPIFVGKSDSFTGKEVDASRRLADEQVFAPERQRMDNFFTKEVFLRLGIVWSTFKSLSANVTENADLIRILAAAEKSGGSTPRIARKALGAVVNKDLGEVDASKLDPDQPFTLTLAKIMKDMTSQANGGGDSSSQGRAGIQTEGPGRDRANEPAADDLGKMIRNEFDSRFGGFVSTAFDDDSFYSDDEDDEGNE